MEEHFFYTPNPWDATPFGSNVFGEKTWFVVVLGEPGSGKTTTLKKMSLDYAEKANEGEIAFSGIPVFIPLREFAKERKKGGIGYTLINFMYDYSKGNLNALCSPGFFEYYLEVGDNLVCLDGLDEVTSVGQRQEIKEIVESFIQRYPKNRYIVTSRISGYDQAPLSRRLFAHYVVNPLNDEQIHSYIKQWYSLRESTTAAAEKQTKELYDAILKQDRILKLARNPLLLTIISLIHKVEATLPNDRVKLYERCAEALLNTFENNKQIENRDEEKEYFRFKADLLEAVAYWMQQETKDQEGREVVVDEGDLLGFLTEYLNKDSDFELSKKEARQQAESFVTLIQDRTGILVERGKGQYAFVHLTFQEYFAASYICKAYLHSADELLNTINLTLFEPSWKEVNLLLLGKLGHLSKKMPSILADKILKANSEDILHRALQFFTSALADNVKFDKSIQDRIFQDWLTILKNPICETELRFAIDALRSMHIVLNFDDSLIGLAKDTNQNTRFRLNITRVYLEDGKPLDWVFNNLQSLIFEPDIDELTLANSMDFILKKEFSMETRGQLLLAIQKSDFWRKQILALVLNHKFISDYRPFREDIVPLKEYLSIDIANDIPEFSLVFAQLGIDAMWNELLLSLNSRDKSTKLLSNLLYKVVSLFWAEPFDSHGIRQPYVYYIDVPPDFKDKFIDCLLAIIDYQVETPVKISVIQWLQYLEAPNNKIFNSALTIEDDFNLNFQKLFSNYIKEMGVDKETSQYPVTLLRITESIFTAPSAYVKLSYFGALVANSNNLLLEKTFIEWLSRDDLSIATKYIILTSWGYELLKDDKVVGIIQSWLGATDGWEQAFIAGILLNLNKVDKSAISIILNQLKKIDDPFTIKELIVMLRKHGADEEAMMYAKTRIGLHQTMSIGDRMFRGCIYNAICQPVKKYSLDGES